METQTILEQIQQVLSEPTSNLPAASLLLAAVTLLILILVLMITFFVVGSGRREATDEPRSEVEGPSPERGKKPRTPAARVTTAVITMLILGSVVVTYAATGSSDYCAGTCHADDDAVLSAEEDPHAGVSCVSCHEEPLPFGAIPNLVTRARFLAAEALPAQPMESRDVPSVRCLKCHDGVLTEVVFDPDTGVRMAHEHPIDAGMACADCHRSPGHGGPRIARGMTTCLGCHDGDQAGSECVLCHQADTSLASDSADRLYGSVRLVTDCSGCHDQAACDACHGTRMPHDSDFLARGHARYAGFDLKEDCYGCHPREDCWVCHEPFERSGHVGNWRVEHGKFPFESPCGCHQPLGSTDSFCAECHDR